MKPCKSFYTPTELEFNPHLYTWLLTFLTKYHLIISMNYPKKNHLDELINFDYFYCLYLNSKPFLILLDKSKRSFMNQTQDKIILSI